MLMTVRPLRLLITLKTMSHFQHDHLCSWSQLNSMDFYIKKCKVMRISRKKQPLDANLLVYDSSSDIVSEFKDLGLLIPSEAYRCVSGREQLLGQAVLQMDKQPIIA
ncbi:uncharacterized protein LOC141891902 isoform X1 [Acropora palmata]|uniref:uncharacterized protein LOC141891902 isoform X1 n=1 Tax=Acropora palmata TaxID=6131 RepID=UPI003DA0046E